MTTRLFINDSKTYHRQAIKRYIGSTYIAMWWRTRNGISKLCCLCHSNGRRLHEWKGNEWNEEPNTYLVRHIAPSPSRMTCDLNTTKLTFIHFYYTEMVQLRWLLGGSSVVRSVGRSVGRKFIYYFFVGVNFPRDSFYLLFQQIVFEPIPWGRC